jgi:hypothetical protein
MGYNRCRYRCRWVESLERRQWSSLAAQIAHLPAFASLSFTLLPLGSHLIRPSPLGPYLCSQVQLSDEVKAFIRDSTQNYGKVKLVLKRNKFYVESPYPDVRERERAACICCGLLGN